MFGKEAPSPVQAILGGAASIRPDGTRQNRKVMTLHSSTGEVLQQVGLLVSTQFSLEWRSVLRSFPWNSAPPFRKVLGGSEKIRSRNMDILGGEAIRAL
jgi:hypothetical protein